MRAVGDTHSAWACETGGLPPPSPWSVPCSGRTRRRGRRHAGRSSPHPV